MINFLTLKILKIFDLYKQNQLIKFLKKKKNSFNIVFDVGAHHGESINLYLRKFKVNEIYSFEPIKSNFEILKYNLNSFKKKFKNTKIFIENFALGSEIKKINIKVLNESSSSTFNDINVNSKYFKKKKLFLPSLNENNFFSEKEVQVLTLCEYIEKKGIKEIDFMKIDTEGYEYDVLLGLKSHLDKVLLVMFEHHYDDMLCKNYTFGDIHNLLIKNNFKQVFKYKMSFRKTFEYIYEKKNSNNFGRNI